MRSDCLRQPPGCAGQSGGATVYPVTQQDTTRTYDDLPESDVLTVLQVPLLWGSKKGSDRPPVGAHRRPSGRHRADGRARGSRVAATPGTGTRAAEQPRRQRQATVRNQPVTRRQGRAPVSGWADHPMAHTARVGLVSAGLVLTLFAGVLLALAVWLP